MRLATATMSRGTEWSDSHAANEPGWTAINGANSRCFMPTDSRALRMRSPNVQAG